MIVTDLNGNTEMVTDYKNLERVHRVNGDHSISFLLLETDNNKHSFPLVVEESVIGYDDKQYRIKQLNKKSFGGRSIKEVLAYDTFFDLMDNYQYDTLNGELTINQCLTHALQGTNYTFSIIDAYNPINFDSFGDDNSYALFIKTLQRFNAEYTVNGTNITIKNEIGNQTDYQFRYKYNVQSISDNTSTSNLSTYIKGFGANGITAEYTSPNSNTFGVKHAPAFRDDSYTDQTKLLERIKKELKDEPEVNMEIEFVEMKKAGYAGDAIELGDTVYLIYEPLSVDVTTRVMQLTEYPEEPENTKVVLANIKRNAIDKFGSYSRTQKQLNNILTDGGHVKYDVLDAAVKRASVALNNSLTELEYPDNGGIIARNPSNPDQYVIYNSSGLGITSDGGKTFKQCLTWEGLVADSAWVGQIAANNIDATNLHVSAANIDGTVTAGELRTKSGTTLLSQVYKDVNGGMMKIYDNSGNLNVEVGVEGANATQNAGGKLILYDDNPADPRVSLGIDKALSAGILLLKNNVDATQVALGADSNAGAYLGILDGTETLKTYLTLTEGYINGVQIATMDDLVYKFG